MAKIMMAVGNNGIEGAGVVWSGKIVDYCVGDQAGIHSDATVVAMDRAIDLAQRTHKRIVICASYGAIRAPDAAEKAAIERLRDAGILFVTSAGNEHNDSDIRPSYPASYGADNQIVAAGLQGDGSISPVSNIGRKSVHVFAPANAIVAEENGSYTSGAGTSVSAAYTAGLAALLMEDVAQFPTYKTVKARIMRSVEKLDLPCITGGIIRADRALAGILNPVEPDSLDGVSVKGKAKKITFKCTSDRKDESPVLTASVDGGVVGIMEFDSDAQQYVLTAKMKPRLASGVHQYLITSSLGGVVQGTFNVN